MEGGHRAGKPQGSEVEQAGGGMPHDTQVSSSESDATKSACQMVRLVEWSGELGPGALAPLAFSGMRASARIGEGEGDGRDRLSAVAMDARVGRGLPGFVR